MNQTPNPSLEDQAEERALWNACCLLEKELTAPFQESYPSQRAQARDRLRDPEQ